MDNSVDLTFENSIVGCHTIEHSINSEISPSQLEKDLNSSRNPENRRNTVFRQIIKLVVFLVLGFIIYRYWHSHSKKIASKVFRTVHELVNQNT